MKININTNIKKTGNKITSKRKSEGTSNNNKNNDDNKVSLSQSSPVTLGRVA